MTLEAEIALTYYAGRDIRSNSGPKFRIKRVSDEVRLISFVQHDLGHFDHGTRKLQPSITLWLLTTMYIDLECDIGATLSHPLTVSH